MHKEMARLIGRFCGWGLLWGGVGVLGRERGGGR
jgi:hypothetical protein